MGWHSVDQRLDRVHSNGFVDLQSGGVAVSAPFAHIATLKKLTSPVQVYLGH